MSVGDELRTVIVMSSWCHDRTSRCSLHQMKTYAWSDFKLANPRKWKKPVDLGVKG